MSRKRRNVLGVTTIGSSCEKDDKIAEIWKRTASGEIDLTMAAVGCRYDDNTVLLLNHTLIADLLGEYGYDSDTIFAWIDDYVAAAEDNPDMPIVTIDRNRMIIYSAVERTKPGKS